ncbi:DUF637 domain-containing protein, partial [Halovulum sp. GXIMD14793]
LGLFDGLGTFWQAAAEKALSSVIVETTAGVVSGDLDIGNILEGAAFAGVTAGLTASINASTFGITFADASDIPGGFAFEHLTMENLVERGIDAAISSGLTSAVYGTDFADSFVASFGQSVAALALAESQTLIGDQGLVEGSLGHAALHGLAGCAFAEATGGDCRAGLAAGIAQSLYAGRIDPDAPEFDRNQALNRAELIGAFAGYLFSGGKGENVSAGSSTARSGLENNYLYHEEAVARARAKAALHACESGDTTCTIIEAEMLRQRIAELDAIDEQRDANLLAACGPQGYQGLCFQEIQRSFEAINSYRVDRIDGVETAKQYLQTYGDVAGEIKAELIELDNIRLRVRDMAGPAWDPGSFGAGLAIGGGLSLAGISGVSIVSEAVAACGTNTACLAGVIGTTVGTEVLVEFSGGAMVVSASGKVLRSVDMSDVALFSRATSEPNVLSEADDVAAGVLTRVGSDRPYNPIATRNELEARYGEADVTSTTVPPAALRGEPGSTETVLYNGQEVRITFNQRGFPVFDDVAVYDTRVAFTDVSGKNYSGSMRAATRDLRSQINAGLVDPSQFSTAQLRAIRGGSPTIPGYTWHHHEEVGRMQLIPREVHGCVSHAGGHAMCQGR